MDVEGDLDDPNSFRGVENLDEILRVFERFNIQATLFVTGEVLGKYPDLIVKWSRNHEIACHGYYHVPLHKLSIPEREDQLDDFWRLYERTLGQEPKGFRAVQHTIDEAQLKLLEGRGFVYDGSVVSRYVPLKRYAGYKGKAPTEPYHPSYGSYRERGNMSILEIPVVPLAFGIPFTGSWIRVLGQRFYTLLLLIKKPAWLSLSAHSWDCIEFAGRYSRNSGARFLGMLPGLLECLERDYAFANGAQLCDKSKILKKSQEQM